MAKNAIRSQGATLEIKVGSAFVKVGGFNGFSDLGGGSTSTIDVSDFDSVAKEKLAGLRDEGQVSIELRHLPKDAGQIALRAARAASSVNDYQITDSEKNKYAFSGLCVSMPISASADDAMQATATIEISGALVITPVA